MNPWHIITIIGDPIIWAWICLFMVVLYFTLRLTLLKNRPAKRRIFKGATMLFIISIVVNLFIIHLMKIGFSIPRSCIVCPMLGCNPFCLPDSSFPSGHTAAMFTLFMSFSITIRSKWNAVILVLAVLVGISRIILGVHTPVDIVAGAALGVLGVILIWKAEKRLRIGQITPK